MLNQNWHAPVFVLKPTEADLLWARPRLFFLVRQRALGRSTTTWLGVLDGNVPA